jgi:hypothetical protein
MGEKGHLQRMDAELTIVTIVPGHHTQSLDENFRERPQQEAAGSSHLERAAGTPALSSF